jgi:hypothetical protein
MPETTGFCGSIGPVPINFVELGSQNLCTANLASHPWLSVPPPLPASALDLTWDSPLRAN